MVSARARTGLRSAFQLILLVCACGSVPMAAQHYPILAVPGSPKNITTLFQDSKGRMWLGTKDDLLAFDGTRFFSMRAFGFPEESVTSVAEDSDGGIWAAAGLPAVMTKEGERFPGGLYRYWQGHVERIRPWSFSGVVSLAPGIMLATMTTDHRFEFNDLYRFQKQGNSWKAELLLSHQVGTIRVDHQGNAVFPCPAGWCEILRQQLLEPPREGVKPVQHSFASNGHALHSVLRDRYGCVWGRSDSESFYGCDSEGKISRLPLPWNGVTGSNYVLEESPDGRVLMVSGTSLVYGRAESPKVIPGEKLPNGIWGVLAAADGTIWFTDYAEILHRFPYPFLLESWNENDGISSRYSFLRLGGRLYAGGPSGIDTLDADRHHWSQLPGSQALGQVSALAAGPGGTLYAAGFEKTVAQLTPAGKIVAASTTDDFGVSMATDETGQLWLGAGKGVFQVRRHGAVLDTVSQGLPSEQCTAMKYDPVRKVLWAYIGEQVFARQNGVWRQIGQHSGLPARFGEDLAAAPDGDLWLAYADDRFSWLHNPVGAGGKPLMVASFANPPGTIANILSADRRGQLWRVTNIEDLYLANTAEAEAGAWLRFGLQDGLSSQGGARGSFFNDADGSVWYSTMNSVVHLSLPDDFLTRFPRPKIFVSSFSAGSSAPSFAGALQKLPHGEDLIAHIGSLQFDRRHALRLRWRLLPEQAAWQNGSDLDLHLGKLHWGTHRLQVQAQMGVGSVAGAWSDVAEQSFDVLLPAALRWPSLYELMAGAAALAFALVQWRKKLKARAEKRLPELAEWRMEALSSELHKLEGTRLDGRFAVGELMARGGFASVLQGVDLSFGNRPCAIKVFRQELLDKDWMERRFQQEVAALERIHHPNVVAIYGSGRLPSGAFYLVMEFIDGQTLRELLESGRLAMQQTSAYLLELGSALRAIHEQDICHRDLKPENVMLRNPSIPGNELVLIDFSIAIVKDADESLYGLSRAAGTFYYMAPEQAIGFADCSTDIHSLAKILIEMLTGQRLSTLLPDASMDLPDRVRGLLRALSLPLSEQSIETIAQALEFDPSRRPKDAYAFATQIADDLNRL